MTNENKTIIKQNTYFYKILKYAAAFICLLLLVTAAAVPIVRLAAIGDNFEDERIAFEKAVQEDFAGFLPDFTMETRVYRESTDGYAYVSILIRKKGIRKKGGENQTGFTNAQIIAHVRNFCLDYIDKHKDSDLYKSFSNKNHMTFIDIYVGLYDKQYRSWENLNSLSFGNDYLFDSWELSGSETGRLFDKIYQPDSPITMNDLKNFTDVSQICVRDIIADSIDEYDFSEFVNLKYIRLCMLEEADTQKINAIKSALPKNCKFWISDSSGLKEVK